MAAHDVRDELLSVSLAHVDRAYDVEIIDALLPTVERIAQKAAAKAWDDGYATGWRETEEQPYSDRPERATWRPTPNPYRAEAAERGEGQ